MKPFLILQLRANDRAADSELKAILQFGQLKVHEVQQVRMEKTGIPSLNVDDYAGVIVGGGSSNVSDPENEKSNQQQKFESDLSQLLDQIVSRDVPYFGACYGFGALAQHQEGTVTKDKYAEPVGAVTIQLTEEAKNDLIMQGIPEKFEAFVGHKEACQKLPNQAVLLAGSASCPFQMFRIKSNIYATQFHPELDNEGLILRINIYKNDGYFRADQLDALTQKIHEQKVDVPQMILKQFVTQYR